VAGGATGVTDSSVSWARLTPSSAVLLGLVSLTGCGGAADARSAVALDSVRAELAPQGVLRVAVAVAPAASTFFSTRDPTTGELIGAGVFLGAELAEELCVQVEYVVFPNSGELTDAGARGEWDVTFMPVDDERSLVVDFGPAYNLFESTYLVAPGSSIPSIDQVDREGVRVGAIANTTTGRSAERQLRAASIHFFRTVDELTEAIRAGEMDAAALGQASLQQLAADLPGSRILEGSFHATANAVAVPKGRPLAAAYVADFIEAAKASGSVRRAFDRAGLPEARVAPRMEGHTPVAGLRRPGASAE